MSTSERTSWLLPLLLVGFVPRIYWATKHTAVIENEGAVYASLAESLLGGRGYIAIFGPDAYFNFPPLYPLLIAAASSLVGDAEWAARVVSVMAGTLLPVPVYLVARTLYDVRVARIAAVLVALHPLLIGYSAATYVEPLYVLFLMMGVHQVLRAQDLDSYLPAVGAGFAFALAYLTRVEGLVLPLAAVPLLLVPNWRRLRRATIACGIVLVCFVTVASPYIVFLWAQTGSIRFEAKGAVFFLFLQRMASGLSYLEAAYGLEGDLVEGGVFIRPWLPMLESTRHGFSDILGYLVAAGPSRIVTILSGLREVGSALLLLLAILGLLRSPWDRARVFREAMLFTILAAGTASLLMTQWQPTRYLLPPLAFLLIWGAKGTQELAAWVHDTLRSAFPAAPGSAVLVGAVKTLAVVGLLLVALRGARGEAELLQGLVSSPEQPTKEAGLWLRTAAPGPKTIMDVSSIFTFYAGGTHLYLPQCDAGTALRYLEKKKPDFIVLSSHTRGNRRYLGVWHDAGIPDPRAKLVYSRPRPGGGTIAVYRWGT